MFEKIRNRAEGDQGFTLIELLVVILIIGILAAIAIPSFLNQREKGQDACAKSMARTMQTAMETYYLDNNTYVGAAPTALTGIENQIAGGKCGAAATIATGDVATAGDATSAASCGTGAPGLDKYCVAASSSATSGGTGGTVHTFTIGRDATGTITRFCGPTARGGCVAAGTW
jgi:type IV pilus assembly protein PilA